MIYCSSPMESSQLQSTTTSYGQWRQRRYIQLTGRTPHPTQGSTPWSPRIAQFNAGCKSQDLLHWLRCERATFGTPGQRTACAATQGIRKSPTNNNLPYYPDYNHKINNWNFYSTIPKTKINYTGKTAVASMSEKKINHSIAQHQYFLIFF